MGSLSNSCRHAANANVIANVKNKIIVSCQHFFADVIFSATVKIPIPKQIWAHYIFQGILKTFLNIYMLYSLSLENCKQLRKWNRIYRSLLPAMFFFNRYLI